MVELILAILSGAVGAIAGLVVARKYWFEGSKVSAEAEDAADDRVIEKLKEYYELKLKMERLEYEKRLAEEIAELRAEFNQRINALIDVYACQNAADGCERRVVPKQPIRGF